MRYLSLCLFCLVLFTAAGCGAVNDPFVGEYSTQPGVESFLKVTKEKGIYYFSTREEGKWAFKQEVKELEAEDFQSFNGVDCEGSITGGIGSDIAVILRVKEGGKCGTVDFESGYLFIGFFGMDFLYKVK